MSNHEIERIEPAAEEVVPLVPLLEVAVKIGVEPTTIRRWIWKGEVEAKRRDGSGGYLVNVATLPLKYRAAYATEIAAPPALHVVTPDEEVSRYSNARDTVRERAEVRYEAVLSFAKARLGRGEDETLGQVERRWLRNFRRSHAGFKVSVRSVKAWTEMFRKGGGKIDALIDGNDGIKQRGARIPAAARQMFKDEYLRAHKPNVRLIYDNVVAVAKVKEWGEMPSYDTFWRFAKSLPKMVRKLLRDCADTPRAVLPHVRRDPTTLPAYHTIQSDHREIDVPVRCDKGCEVCTGKKPQGHFPIWTAFIDIRSRRILGSDLAIDAPNSERILSVFRRISDENGLTRRVYLDNGSDYRKAFGKRLRASGKSEWDGPNEEQMQVRFAPLGIEVVYAIPYNAQAKAIERMFRTFRHRFDEDFEAYRGTLGDKSEFARELYYRPSELPTISELAYLLGLAVGQYNASPHSGRGMDGRTPDEVFYDPEIRMPRREPDRSFGYLFFDLVKGGRIVGTNGIQLGGYVYRLKSLQKHLEYFGERVDVRVNPDDVRNAMVFDRRTGAYVCDAVIDDEATYDTRDEITRQLIARVFGDGKELLKMARAHVEGAKERLGEYRRAKLEYLERRAKEIEAARREAETALTGTDVVTVISKFSAVSRQRETERVVELTASVITEILDRDGSEASESLCVVSTSNRERKRERARHLPKTEIANRLGVSRETLSRYETGRLRWPEGMQERHEALVALRASTREALGANADQVVPVPHARRRVTQLRGELSYASIAKQLGTSAESLLWFRKGKRPWPNEAMRARYEELVSRRKEVTG